MKSLYIVLTCTSTIFAKSIRYYTKKTYSHASISLDDSFETFYSFGRKYKRNPFIGHFATEHINTGLFSLYSNIPAIILKVPVTDEQYEDAQRELDRIIENRHMFGYNYLGILYGLRNKPYKDEYRFFCSEFVYHILKTAKVLKDEFDLKSVEPEDFLGLGYEIVYEGNLKNLLNYNISGQVSTQSI